MRHHRFTISGPPRVAVRLPLGQLRVVAGEMADTVDVDLDGRESSVARFIVEQRGGTVHIEPERSQRMRWTGVDIVVRVPPGTALHSRLTAGDLDVRVDLAELVVETASGDVVASDVSGDVEIRSASGDIRLGAVGGRLSVTAASGDVRLGSATSAEIKTASGNVLIGGIVERGSVRTASGDITVERLSGAAFDAKSLAGDVLVGVVAGRRYDVGFSSLSGDIRTDFPVQGGEATGAPGRIDITTVSGDIRITAAVG